MTEEAQEQKLCFVVIPIGKEGSDTRIHSDKVFRFIVKPAAEACGYTSIRAIEDKRPGIIGNQIIDHLFEADLVIADLSEHNPNVFYEVAIRHATHKPIVQIIRSIDHIPFDVAQQKTISFDLTDLYSVENCKNEIINQIREVEANPALVDNPISTARRISAALESPNPEVRSNAEMLAVMEGMAQQLNAVSAAVARLQKIDGFVEVKGSISKRLARQSLADQQLHRERAVRLIKDATYVSQDGKKIFLAERLSDDSLRRLRMRVEGLLAAGETVTVDTIDNLIETLSDGE